MAHPIRELSLAELPAITDLRREMVREIDGEDLDATTPGWRDRYVAFFGGYQSSGRGGVWVVEDAGEIIGLTAAYMPQNHRTEIVGSLQLYICNVYVKPPWRRRGIAKALTLHAMEWARRKGCSVIRLRSSDMGRAVYASVGFVPSNEMEFVL